MRMKAMMMFLKQIVFMLFLLFGSNVFAADLQVVTPDPSSQVKDPDTAVSIKVSYAATNEELVGLGLRMHYDSTKLTYVDLTDVLPTHYLVTQEKDDSVENFDGDSSTDRFVVVVWADSSVNPIWPGIDTTPATLYIANFTTKSTFSGSTSVKFTASATHNDWDLSAMDAIVSASGNGDL